MGGTLLALNCWPQFSPPQGIAANSAPLDEVKMLHGGVLGRVRYCHRFPQYLAKSRVPAVCQVQRNHSGVLAGTGRLAFLCAGKGVQLSRLIL